MQYRYIGCRTCDHKSSIPNDWAWVTDWRVYKLDGDVVFPMLVSDMWCDDCEALTISESWPDDVQIDMNLRRYTKDIDSFRRGENPIFVNANLVAVYLACVHVAAKCVERVPYARLLPTMLTWAAGGGATVSAAQAACMELDVLTTLEWRLAPNFVRKEDD